MATIPDALPAEYATELAEAAEPGAADGLGLRQAAHDGRTRRRLAGQVRELRTSARPRPPRSARCIAPAPMTAPSWPASCNIPTCSRRSKPICSSCKLLLRHPPPHGPGDRHHRDRQGDRRAHSRGTRLSARGQARRALPRDARRTPIRSACRRSGPNCRPAGCSPSTGSRASACSTTRATTSKRATGSATAMFTAWWFPFSRFGVIHGDPHLGNYSGVRSADGMAGRHQPARLRLHPHFPAELRRRRGRSLSRLLTDDRRPGRPCL